MMEEVLFIIAIGRSPPLPNVIQINSDASWHQSSLSSGIAAIASDSNGILAPSPLAAEAMAIREAILIALAFPSHDIIITSDSKNLIHCLQNDIIVSDWKAASLVSQVRYLSLSRQIS